MCCQIWCILRLDATPKHSNLLWLKFFCLFFWIRGGWVGFARLRLAVRRMCMRCQIWCILRLDATPRQSWEKFEPNYIIAANVSVVSGRSDQSELELEAAWAGKWLILGPESHCRTVKMHRKNCVCENFSRLDSKNGHFDSKVQVHTRAHWMLVAFVHAVVSEPSWNLVARTNMQTQTLGRAIISWLGIWGKIQMSR